MVYISDIYHIKFVDYYFFNHFIIFYYTLQRRKVSYILFEVLQLFQHIFGYISAVVHLTGFPGYAIFSASDQLLNPRDFWDKLPLDSMSEKVAVK